MPTDMDRAERIIKLVTAGADAVRVLSGHDGAAAARLSAVIAEEIEGVISRRAKRATSARAARKARSNSF